MLTDLTPEQEKLFDSVGDAVAEEYLAVLSRGDEVSIGDARPALEMVYGFYESALPEIEICDSPEAALLRAKALGVASPFFDWCGTADAGWLAHYETFARLHTAEVPLLTEEEATDMRKLQRMLLLGGVYDTVLLDERALIVRFPRDVHVNARGDMHCATGPAIHWRDGQAEYCWNGVFVSKQLIESPDTITKKEALALPTEERRAFCERFGWGPALALFECSLSDSWTDPKTGLSYELYAGPDDAILKKQSPKLMTGEQPHYCEPVHRDLKTAQAARKWQPMMRPGKDPALVARECNRDPELSYGIEA